MQGECNIFSGRRAGVIAAEYIVLWRYVLDDSGTGINGSLFLDIERKEEQEGTAAISERVSGSAAVTADFSSGRIFS